MSSIDNILNPNHSSGGSAPRCEPSPSSPSSSGDFLVDLSMLDQVLHTCRQVEEGMRGCAHTLTAHTSAAEGLRGWVTADALSDTSSDWVGQLNIISRELGSRAETLLAVIANYRNADAEQERNINQIRDALGGN